MPKKVLRSQSAHYPFPVLLNKTRVLTREGKGIVIDKQTEWIYVQLEKNGSIIKTSIFLTELIETA
ncbi:hypothetical protein SK3146_06125 [Paenibacillus konkukensis]|uniref:Uncharacterized protein n=2 Tax=Paenibacillus konkukensis TaxID=2020716 RepID=A0ABY4RWZ4_9BACL|nr:hypothetical protein [Paenibacillus doosanensis]UQZ86832.1 hypothetical protein SK3146_06125 [Paenibacillus konkukensis]